MMAIDNQQLLSQQRWVEMVKPIIDIGRAIGLLRRMVNIDPIIKYDDKVECYFCGDTVSHFPDCSYLLAKQLLEEIDNGRPQTKIP